jgi:hypothetical protein
LLCRYVTGGKESRTGSKGTLEERTSVTHGNSGDNSLKTLGRMGGFFLARQQRRADMALPSKGQRKASISEGR